MDYGTVYWELKCLSVKGNYVALVNYVWTRWQLFLLEDDQITKKKKKKLEISTSLVTYIICEEFWARVNFVLRFLRYNNLHSTAKEMEAKF